MHLSLKCPVPPLVFWMYVCAYDVSCTKPGCVFINLLCYLNTAEVIKRSQKSTKIQLDFFMVIAGSTSWILIAVMQLTIMALTQGR